MIRTQRALALALALAVLLFAGCGAQPGEPGAAQSASAAPSSSRSSAETQPDPSAAQTLFVAVNGAELRLGMRFSEAAACLGAESKPAETVSGTDWKQTQHFYPGLTISEDRDGRIDSIQLHSEDGGIDAAILGELRVGMRPAEYKAILGEPDIENPDALFYEHSDPCLSLYVDETTGLIYTACLILPAG